MYTQKLIVVCAVVALAAGARAAPEQGSSHRVVNFSRTPNSNENTVETNGDVKKSVIERFPHAVLYGLTCGGTIISPTWILTAGHCTLFSASRSVLAGTDNSEDGSGVSVGVKRMIIHPLFSVGPYWLDAYRFDIKQVAARWDFLLVELTQPLKLDNIKLAAVQLGDQLDVGEGLDVAYAGYGTDHHGGTMRHQMHAMELSTVADATCASKLEQYNAQDMVCTKGRPPRFDSACNGDSGSGLVANGKLIGVASWVENDAHECRNGNLVIFSKVASVRDWIRNVTGV